MSMISVAFSSVRQVLSVSSGLHLVSCQPLGAAAATPARMAVTAVSVNCIMAGIVDSAV